MHSSNIILTGRSALLCLTSSILLSLNSCTFPPPNQSGTALPVPTQSAQNPAQKTVAQPLVVATSSVLCGLIQEIAEDTVNLQCLIGPGVDAHEYQMKPQDRKAIEMAQLIFYSGYNLEPALTRAVQNASNPAPKVPIDQLAVPQPLMAESHDHGEEKDHNHDPKAEGQEKQEPDPHIWHDAKNGIRMAELIRDRLIQLIPTQAERYKTNTQKLTRELTQLDAWIRSQIATIPATQRRLITTHDALGYYAKAYGIPLEGALEGVNTEARPSANRIKELIEQIRAEKVPTIFPEVAINPQLIEQIAKEAGVRVSQQQLYADGLGASGTAGETYQKMLISNTRAIVEGLGGKFTPFQPKPE